MQRTLHMMALLIGIVVMPICVACQQRSSPVPRSAVGQVVDQDTLPMPKVGSVANKAVPHKTRTKLSRQKADLSCAPDVVGSRADNGLRDKIKDKLAKIWAREVALVTRAEWAPFMPTGDASTVFKLVSFEVSNQSAAGHFHPGFKCIRMRFLANTAPSATVTLIENGWQVKQTSKSLELEGRTNRGRWRVSVGLNRDLVTQVDVSLVPADTLDLNFPFAQNRTLLESFRQQSLAGFEYGVFASAQPGLKFPGLERAVLVVKGEESDTKRRFEAAGFKKQEKGQDYYQNEHESYTYRRYSPVNLAIFWQLRLTPEKLSPYTIAPRKRNAKPSP